MIWLCGYFFVFFKQKTAYEMRISDWSSDVCSSDLTTGSVGVVSGLLTGYAGMPGPPVVPYYVGRHIARDTAKASMMLIFTFAAMAGITSGAEIGRASCRERVCQYV